MSTDSSELCDLLVCDLAHNESAIRTAAAEALAAALTDHSTYIPPTLDLVLDLYSEHLKVSELGVCSVYSVSQKHPRRFLSMSLLIIDRFIKFLHCYIQQ